MADVIKKGKGTMPAYAGTLSDTEIQAVSQYVVRSQKIKKSCEKHLLGSKRCFSLRFG